jgi:hypothetical protein
MSIQTQEQAVVEQRRMINAIVVANESIGDAAQFEQAIPVGIVACQPGDLQTEHDSHVGHGHFAGQAGEAGTFLDAGTREAEIFIEDDDLLFGPAQLAGAIGERILAGGGFAILFHLRRCGLAKVNKGGALQM